MNSGGKERKARKRVTPRHSQTHTHTHTYISIYVCVLIIIIIIMIIYAIGGSIYPHLIQMQKRSEFFSFVVTLFPLLLPPPFIYSSK